MAQSKKPLALALGAAFLASAVVPVASAEANPFAAEQLNTGYNLANYGSHGEGDHEGKCGEGSCGEKEGEGKCGEKDGEGKDGEGKCGEGKCGGA